MVFPQHPNRLGLCKTVELLEQSSEAIDSHISQKQIELDGTFSIADSQIPTCTRAASAWFAIGALRTLRFDLGAGMNAESGAV
jgi:hypothetical protein